MKVMSYSSLLQFSKNPTELDHMFEAVVDGLQEIAIGIADIGRVATDLFEDSSPTKSVASRLVSQSSKFSLLMQTVREVRAELERVKVCVDRGALMAFDTYDVSRLRVNNSSKYIEKELNLLKRLLGRGPTYKKAYYQETQVIIEYVGLVRRFNECVAAYRELHNITDAAFKDANVGLSIFRLKSDVSNLPSVNQAPENSDVDRGYKK